MRETFSHIYLLFFFSFFFSFSFSFLFLFPFSFFFFFLFPWPSLVETGDLEVPVPLTGRSRPFPARWWPAARDDPPVLGDRSRRLAVTVGAIKKIRKRERRSGLSSPMKSDGSCRRRLCPQAWERRERREEEEEGLTTTSDDLHRRKITASTSRGATASIEKIGEEHRRSSVNAMSSLRGEEGGFL